MATINLGSIKFKWQGAYNGATAYTVDDVVSYNGSSYICILASTGNLPTNATYWEQMSSAGTNGTDGTDLGTTLTTQGDIVYRDASGLARLGAGTSGQVLQTGGAGANPSWVDSSGGVLQSVSNDNNSFSQSYSGGTLIDIESSSGVTWETSITPSSTSSKLLVLPSLMFRTDVVGNDARYTFNIQRKVGSGSYSLVFNMYEAGAYDRGNSGILEHSVHSPIFIDEPNTTSAVTYKAQFQSAGAGTIDTFWGGSPGAIQRITLLELGV